MQRAFSIGTRVRVKFPPVYESGKVPRGSLGRVIGFRDRYQGTPNTYSQVIVDIDGATSTMNFSGAGYGFAFEKSALEIV